MKKILLACVFLAFSVAALNTSMGVEASYEYVNMSLIPGYHSLALNVSLDACDTNLAYTRNFTQGIYNGRSNVTVNFESVYARGYYWSYWVDGVYKGCEYKPAYGGEVNASVLNASDNYTAGNWYSPGNSSSKWVTGFSGLCIGVDCITSWSSQDNLTGSGVVGDLAYFAFNASNLGSIPITSLADTHVHNASNVTAGTFGDGTGNYTFPQDLDVLGNVFAGWFLGLFNWSVGNAPSSDYLAFNGSTLEFNETFLNQTIDARDANSGGNLSGYSLTTNYLLKADSSGNITVSSAYDAGDGNFSTANVNVSGNGTVENWLRVGRNLTVGRTIVLNDNSWRFENESEALQIYDVDNTAVRMRIYNGSGSPLCLKSNGELHTGCSFGDTALSSGIHAANVTNADNLLVLDKTGVRAWELGVEDDVVNIANGSFFVSDLNAAARRLYLDLNGYAYIPERLLVGGTTLPTALIHVVQPGDADSFLKLDDTTTNRVQVYGNGRTRIQPRGGEIQNLTDATGYLITDSGSSQLRIDNNEIQATTGGSASYLHLNSLGGGVNVGVSSSLLAQVDPTGEVYFPYAYSDDVAAKSPRAAYLGSDGQLGYSSSSIRFKENVRNKTNSSGVLRLTPRMYDRKNTTIKNETGLIAEEVAEINPKYVSYRIAVDRSVVPAANVAGWSSCGEYNRTHAACVNYTVTDEPETVNYGGNELISDMILELRKNHEKIEKLEKENIALKKAFCSYHLFDVVCLGD